MVRGWRSDGQGCENVNDEQDCGSDELGYVSDELGCASDVGNGNENDAGNGSENGGEACPTISGFTVRARARQAMGRVRKDNALRQ